MTTVFHEAGIEYVAPAFYLGLVALLVIFLSVWWQFRQVTKP